MEFSPEPDDEDLTVAYSKRRLETIESYDETNSLEDTNSIGHRDSISQTDPRDSSSYIATSYQDSNIDSSNSDCDDN